MGTCLTYNREEIYIIHTHWNPSHQSDEDAEIYIASKICDGKAIVFIDGCFENEWDTVALLKEGQQHDIHVNLACSMTRFHEKYQQSYISKLSGVIQSIYTFKDIYLKHTII